jgi:hypothetical protein
VTGGLAEQRQDSLEPLSGTGAQLRAVAGEQQVAADGRDDPVRLALDGDREAAGVGPFCGPVV